MSEKKEYYNETKIPEEEAKPMTDSIVLKVL